MSASATQGGHNQLVPYYRFHHFKTIVAFPDLCRSSAVRPESWQCNHERVTDVSRFITASHFTLDRNKCSLHGQVLPMMVLLNYSGRMNGTFFGALYHPPRPLYTPTALLDYIETCVEEIMHDFPAATIVLAGDFNQLTVKMSSSVLDFRRLYYNPPEALICLTGYLSLILYTPWLGWLAP